MWARAALAALFVVTGLHAATASVGMPAIEGLHADLIQRNDLIGDIGRIDDIELRIGELKHSGEPSLMMAAICWVTVANAAENIGMERTFILSRKPISHQVDADEYFSQFASGWLTRKDRIWPSVECGLDGLADFSEPFTRERMSVKAHRPSLYPWKDVKSGNITCVLQGYLNRCPHAVVFRENDGAGERNIDHGKPRAMTRQQHVAIYDVSGLRNFDGRARLAGLTAPAAPSFNPEGNRGSSQNSGENEKTEREERYGITRSPLPEGFALFCFVASVLSGFVTLLFLYLSGCIGGLPPENGGPKDRGD